jgi:type IV pilus assembly protein PilW
MKEMAVMNRCKGVTLVELMIALVISLMLMAGAVSIFISTKETYKLEEDLSRIQENFRYIADRLTRDLTLTGYTGCSLPFEDATASVHNRLSGNAGDRWIVQGTEGGSATEPDTLTISYAKPTGGADVLVGTGTNTTDPIYISTSTSLYKALKDNLALDSENQVGIALLVANCDGGDIFVATGLYEHSDDDDDSPSSGVVGLEHEVGQSVGSLTNAEASFSVAYGHPDLSRARVFSTEDVTYQICTDSSGETGLCVSRGGGSLYMLMPEVTNIQVEYGLDSDEDGSADRYDVWSNAVNDSDITGIKVTLTMVLTQDGGNDVTSDYSFIVKLRNMGLDAS